MKDTVSGEYRLLESGNTWTLPQVPVPQSFDPPIPAGDPRLYSYDNFYGQPNKVMAIPSQQTLQQDAAAPAYSFQINWGNVWSGYIQQNIALTVDPWLAEAEIEDFELSQNYLFFWDKFFILS